MIGTNFTLGTANTLGKFGQQSVAMAGDKITDRQSSDSKIRRYSFAKPIKSSWGLIKEAEIVINENHEILNAYTISNTVLSCIRSKDGKVFVKHQNNLQDFDTVDFMDAMQLIMNRIEGLDKTKDDILKHISNVAKNENLSINKTGKSVTIRSVLVPEKDDAGNKIVEYYTISPSGKLTVSNMAISPKKVIFTIPKIDGERDFNYEFELVNGKPNEDPEKIKVYFNKTIAKAKSFSYGGTTVNGSEIDSTPPEYKFKQSEIGMIINILHSIQGAEHRKEYKDLLMTIYQGVGLLNWD